MNQNKNILKEIDKLKGYKNFDVNAEWDQFLSIAEGDSKTEAITTKPSRVFRLWPAIAVAASLLLLFGAYNSFWNQNSPEIDIVEEVKPVEEEIKPVQEEPKVEEVIAEAPIKEEISYPIFDGNTVTLEDLTKITLVGNPKIVYPVTFKGKDVRIVELIEGEATFDVAESNTPFKVITADVGISVLGTIFKIITSPEKSVVENIEGSVKFYDIKDETNSVILEAGDIIEFDGNDFVDLKSQKETPKEEPTVDLNKGQFTVGSVLPLIKNRFSDLFETAKKLEIKDSDTISIDINQNHSLEVILEQFVEEFPHLEYIKGKCQGCLILQNKE